MSDAAALMDHMYRRQRHIYDLSRKFYLLGRDEAIARLRPAPGGKVLEIGCGTGRNLIKLAQAYPEARLFGLDVSRAMLATAAASTARARAASRITFAQADATAFDPQGLFGCASFEHVMISYALSMIPPWREALAHALDVVTPGGGRRSSISAIAPACRARSRPDCGSGSRCSTLPRVTISPPPSRRLLRSAA
jgi:S-adenosylmethionine-diacylgycerolhomoserine-N-methlytransferase